MSKTPMDHLMDKVDWRCSRCGAQMGTCACLVKCSCGWSYLTGEQCRNEVHRCPIETVGGRCLWEVGHDGKCEGEHL